MTTETEKLSDAEYIRACVTPHMRMYPRGEIGDHVLRMDAIADRIDALARDNELSGDYTRDYRAGIEDGYAMCERHYRDRAGCSGGDG